MADVSRPRIHNLGDEDFPAYLNLLVYGYSGIGKTPLWGTGGEEMLLMDSDNGIESAIATNAKCDVVSATGFQEVVEVYDFLRYSNDAKKYRWFAWDGISLFMDRVLVDEVLPDAVAKKARDGNAQYVADRGEYLVVQNRVSDLVRRFVSLPINFGMSALVMTGEDPSSDEGTSIYIPFIPGRKGEFSSKISGYMNVVGYYGRTPKGTRRLLTSRTGNGNYFARDRFGAIRTRGPDGKMRPWLDNPTIPKIEELVEEKRRQHGQGQAQRRQRGRRSGVRR